MRRVVIVEDETAAAANLRHMLQSIEPDVEVVALLESVAESVEFFSESHEVDVVFMDIHLADGDSFRIFQSVDIAVPIIFTTAYDEYALQAFKVNSIDYLLKPFKVEDLKAALEKLDRLTAVERKEERERRDVMIEEHASEVLQTMLVRYKDKIIPLKMSDVAFFYTYAERVTVTTMLGESYPVDKTLETLGRELPIDEFFRANRQFIIARHAVKDVAVWFGSRLALNLMMDTPERIIISKARVPEFKLWLQSLHRK